tara:strand:- start:395 stop:736 length:342 start_codon:yes stop_codon:yes gene_type:complete
MGRINRTQKYAAMWLHSQGWAVSKIANELELTDAQIKNAVKGSKEKADNGIKTKSAVVSKDPKSSNLMITESNSGSHKVAVMTKAASEQADAIAKEHRAKPTPDNPNIFKPYG